MMLTVAAGLVGWLASRKRREGVGRISPPLPPIACIWDRLAGLLFAISILPPSGAWLALKLPICASPYERGLVVAGGCR